MKSKLYSTFANQYDEATQNNSYNALFERPTLMKLIGNVAGKNLLDLGCGPGTYATELLKQQPKQITCIDYAPEMIEIVKAKLGKQVNAYTQDLTLGLPGLPSDSIDLVICPLMVHYLADLTPLFKDIARVLRRGGMFVFSTHHPFADFQDSVHKNYFQQELLTDIWNTVGEPVTVKFYRRSLSDISQALSNNNLLIAEMSEGLLTPQLKEKDPAVYQRLSTEPNFIFFKTIKA